VKYVNALSKKATLRDIAAVKALKVEKPKKRRRRQKGLLDW
jgi:hypothetical protein